MAAMSGRSNSLFVGRRLLAFAAAALLWSCATGTPGGGDPVGEAAEQLFDGPAPGPAPFDADGSDTLLAEARQAAQAGDPATAERLYRESALLWPDRLEAWQSLAEAARRRGDTAEANAAGFMVERLNIYPSDELYVQRQVNIALKGYVSDQQALPDRNPAQIAYAQRLSEFYDDLLAARGVYEPSRGLFNLAPHEIPTALITGGAGYLYFSTLGGG